MSTCGRRAVADLLAVVEHRGLVLLALTDDDDTVHRDRAEHVTHAVDGGLVGGLLVAGADERRARKRGGLGDAHELKGKVAIRGQPRRVGSERLVRAHGRKLYGARHL